MLPISRESKLKDALEFNKSKLERKKKALEDYLEREANGEPLSSIELERKNILIAETSLLKTFVEELEYILE